MAFVAFTVFSFSNDGLGGNQDLAAIERGNFGGHS
jgi:hypothetical protein